MWYNKATTLKLFEGENLMQEDLQSLAHDSFCYLTTAGRTSGRAHTIEIWFALEGTTLYLLSGGGERADWVKNARQTPVVSVKIRDQVFAGHARAMRDGEEDALARRIVYAKYSPTEEDLEGWAATSLPVAIDLVV
jgi:deazaflavin-dependent oxidoreductase (nitroreductase family)